MKALTFLARRFVAGETPQAAIEVGRRLNAQRHQGHLRPPGRGRARPRGGGARGRGATRSCCASSPRGSSGTSRSSSAPSATRSPEEFCLENAEGILDGGEGGGRLRALRHGGHHGPRSPPSTCFHELRKKYDNVGIVLQAYLHRTKDDVQEAVRRGDRVRLCKGAYKEPAEVAHQAMDDIRKSFKECARLLIDKGNYPALATHDESLVQDVLGWTREQGVAASRYEFQMLYGLQARALGRAGGRRAQHAGLRAVRHALDALLLPPAARAPGERAVRAAEPVRGLTHGSFTRPRRRPGE